MSLASPFFCDTCGAANRAHAAFCAVCGNSLQNPNATSTFSMTLTGQTPPPTILRGRYRILQEVGRGGFGAVYKAIDTQLHQRFVAIKEMNTNNLNPQERATVQADFQREASMLASLMHQHLPRIYEQFSEAGRSYLVMDFIEGETLETVLENLGNKTLPIEKTLDIGIQLCTVLDYLHTSQPPIIFRDLKPANIMLTPRGHVYLIDFGIARIFKPGQAKDTTALGSSGYAAPEQYGKSQTTPRADIYSLGATLHQLLTGHDPSESPFHFAPLQLKQPTLQGLDTLVLSMVSINTNERPASITEVKQELQRIATGITITVPLVMTATGTYQLAQQPKTTPKTITQQSRPQPNTLYVCNGHSSRITALAWSPDGKRIASASYDKTVQLWNASNGQHLLTYRSHLQRVYALAWSPDSTRIVSGGDDIKILLWDADTGKTLSIFSGHNAPVRAIAWSPMGNTIASAGEDALVQVWDAGTCNVLHVHRNHTGIVNALSWSPDSKYLVSGGTDKEVLVSAALPDQQKRSIFRTIFLSTNPIQKRLSGQAGHINALSWSPDGHYIAGAGSNSQLIIWSALTGATTFSHRSSNGGLKNAIIWSPSGNYFASGGNDKMVQVWNLATQQPTFTYYGHSKHVMALAWSPDKTRIASAGVDYTVQIWKLP